MCFPCLFLIYTCPMIGICLQGCMKLVSSFWPMKLKVNPKGCPNLKLSKVLIVSDEIVSSPAPFGKVSST